MTDHLRPMAEMRRGKAQRRGQGTRWLAFAGYAGLGLGCLLLGAVTFLL